MTLSAGQTILGRYVIDEEIGAGGMARVFRGRDTKAQKAVAVKKLDLDPTDPLFEKLRAWFKRELRALMALDHPSIVRLLDHGETDDHVPFVVTEHLVGLDLEETLVVRGWLPQGAVVQIAIDTLQALAAAHALGIVHRDLKPSNVFLCTSGRVVLLDFGLARSLDPTLRTLAQSLGTTLIGTPKYCSPEQLRGVSLSPKSDLYSLGATLVRAACREGLYEQRMPADVFDAITKQHRKPVKELGPDLHPSLVRALEHLVAHEPEKRPGSAMAALDEMEAVAGDVGNVRAALRELAKTI